MISSYTQCGLDMLKGPITKDLEDYNELGIYLSKQTSINALKTLKLLILGVESGCLKKNLDINALRKTQDAIPTDIYHTKENIVSNLSENPQYFALELLDFITRNFEVDWHLETYGVYTIFDYFLRALEQIEYDQAPFYKRYDMVDKRLDMIDFMVEKNLLDFNQLGNINNKFTSRIESSEFSSYTKEQLLRMEIIVNKTKTIRNTITNLKNAGIIDSSLNPKAIYQTLSVDKDERRRIMFQELENYHLINDQCTYMNDNVRELIKQKVII